VVSKPWLSLTGVIFKAVGYRLGTSFFNICCKPLLFIWHRLECSFRLPELCPMLLQPLRKCQSRTVGLNISWVVVGQKEASVAVSWGYRYSNFLWSQNTLAHHLHLANRPHVLMVFTVCEDLYIRSLPFGTAQPCSITTKIHSSHLLMLVTHNL